MSHLLEQYNSQSSDATHAWRSTTALHKDVVRYGQRRQGSLFYTVPKGNERWDGKGRDGFFFSTGCGGTTARDDTLNRSNRDGCIISVATKSTTEFRCTKKLKHVQDERIERIHQRQQGVLRVRVGRVRVRKTLSSAQKN